MPNAVLGGVRLGITCVSIVAACSGDAALEPRDSLAIDYVQLTVGTRSVRLDSTGAGTELRVPAGINLVQALWFRSDGSIESRVNDLEFELRLTGNLGRLLFFNSSGAFGGALRVSLATGEEDSGRFSLFHKAQLRYVFTTTPIRFKPL